MKLNYFPDTDSLYIDLSQRPSVESQEVCEGVVLDYDAEGNLVGIDIDHASQKLNLRELFFFQAEDGIRALYVTGVQTCALPICFRQSQELFRQVVEYHQRLGSKFLAG